MTLILSILAITISLIAILLPVVDKNFKRGYMFSKNYGKDKLYKKINSHYGFHKIPLSWIGTAYHLRNDLVNQSTHSLGMYFLEQKEVKECILYVSLIDFQSISPGRYKLLVEDPFGQVWTDFFNLEREFIEENLDKIIKIEAEIVSKESQDGISLFHPDSKMKNIIKPIKIESTGVPTLIIDVNNR